MESIFLMGTDGTLTRMVREPWDAEELLQRLLVDYPELLSGEQIQPDHPRRWLLVAREQGIRGEEGSGYRWSVDHLFLDQDAIPTLVEVKRSSDTRLRREVVGQMLDYAANAVGYWTIEDVRGSFRETCLAAGQEPDEALRAFLGGGDEEEFWVRVKTNLQAGRMRLLFVADVIPPELRRIIEFLNEQMDPAEVLGVELARFAGGGLETLTPRVMGRTAQAESRKSSGTRAGANWTYEQFIRVFEERNGTDLLPVANAVFDWSDGHGLRRWFGTGASNASFMPALDYQGSSYWPFAVYSDGSVEIKFQYLKDWPPFDVVARREELRQRLLQIPGVHIDPARIDKRPSFRVELLKSEEAQRTFLGALDWCLDEIKARADG